MKLSPYKYKNYNWGSTNNVKDLKQLRHGLFTLFFVGVEMALMIKAHVLYARRLGSEFESKGIKTKYFSFNST